ncbi:MAG: hypothetical protein NDI84_05865 [Steroidobacteraceae bacterium]|nr:hypothetical protein [Steroidobacteraceae bacterium]
MSQLVVFPTAMGSIQLELPDPDRIVLANVPWGAVDALPAPAYWACQVFGRRVLGAPPKYRMGRTLVEEVSACLLGGHGIPAKIGVVAFERLRGRGALDDHRCDEAQLAQMLGEPMPVDGRLVRYRFARQKARYLASALRVVRSAPSTETGRELRDWLLPIPGIGHKTASWVARNWLDADDVAIIDVHILRVGRAIGLFPLELTVERHYLEIERRFLEFGSAIGVRASELDSVIWQEMAASPHASRYLIEYAQDHVDAGHRRPRRSSATSPQRELLAD